jgi:hypothetical protein
MTVKQFLTYLEGYYGEKYSGVFLDTMTNYLGGKSGEFLKAAANVLVRRVSRTYGRAPGVAEIEDNLREIRDTIPRPVALPERPVEITEEERAKKARMLREFWESLGRRRAGPMADILSGVLDNMA